MPELPDITVYVEALRARAEGTRLEAVEIRGISLLRSVEPSLRDVEGKRVVGVLRLGKRIVFALEDELFLVLHLMISGRLHWKPATARLGGRNTLAAFRFEPGTLTLTEASTKKRASLFAVRGEEALRAHDPGGLEVLDASLDAFHSALARESHTLKRALTDPQLFSGIGNAYSDEILHHARLSPVKLTGRLDAAETQRLYDSTRNVLESWTDRLRRETGDTFPEHVTAFRPGMAVHGRYREPCPVCAAPVQRIVQGESESNYCARCQCGGKLLADRALSRLLRSDWPRTLDELELRRKETR